MLFYCKFSHFLDFHSLWSSESIGYELASLFVHLPALCAFSSKPCCVYIIYHFHCVYALVFLYVQLFVGWFFLVFVCLTATHSLWSLAFSSCSCLLVQTLSLFRFSLDAHLIVFSDFSLCCVHFMCGRDSPCFTSFRFSAVSHTVCCGDGRFLCATFRLALFSLWLWPVQLPKSKRFSSYQRCVCVCIDLHEWMPTA